MIADRVTIDSEAAGAIIERAIAGDEVAFARIVAAHHGDGRDRRGSADGHGDR